jgi:hypothetical protein
MTSVEASTAATPRAGVRLLELADVILDTGAPPGDVTWPSDAPVTAAASSLAATALWLRVQQEIVAADPDVELWIAVMAELLSNVPVDRRHLAADTAIATLAAHVRAGGMSAGGATVTAIHDGRPEEHLDGLAARRGVARRDEPHAE